MKKKDAFPFRLHAICFKISWPLCASCVLTVCLYRGKCTMAPGLYLIFILPNWSFTSSKTLHRWLRDLWSPVALLGFASQFWGVTKQRGTHSTRSGTKKPLARALWGKLVHVLFQSQTLFEGVKVWKNCQNSFTHSRDFECILCMENTTPVFTETAIAPSALQGMDLNLKSWRSSRAAGI